MCYRHPSSQVYFPSATRQVTYVVLLSVLTLPLILGACGGQPAPQGYKCGTPSSGHCYGEVFLSLPDSTLDGYHGYTTNIYTTEYITPGDGFITNEFWLTSIDCSCWIEVGYKSESVTGLRYFWAQRRASDGLFIRHDLGPVPAADLGHYGIYDIHETANGTFSISIVNQATNIQDSTSYPIWTQHHWGEVTLGQELQGSTGASAGLVLFLYNSWYDGAGHKHYETHSGALKADKPPYADWLQTPTSTPNGGSFYTECCLPPS